MRVKLIHSEAIMPTMAYKSDAGFDVYHCRETLTIQPNERMQIKLGIAIGIEEDEVAEIHERSSQFIRYGLMAGGPIIDSGYRGEISMMLFNSGSEPYTVWKGDKIGQIVVKKLATRELVKVEELEETERGEKAHFSSGR